jgi:hypothetical protein
MNRDLRNLLARMLVALFAVLPACGAAREPVAPASVPAEKTTPDPVPTTAPGDTPTAAPSPPPEPASATPDPASSPPAATPAPAPATTPAPVPTPVPAQCRGSSIDLTAALGDEACVVADNFVAPERAPDAVVISVEPAQPKVKRGAWTTLRVVFENRSNTPCSLVFLFAPNVFGFGSAGGSLPRPTGGFSAKAHSFFATGDPFDSEPPSLDDPPGPVVLGGELARQRARVELEPGGRAVATVNWQAVGFLPGKRYRPKRDAWGTEFWVPERLPRGPYMLRIHTSLEGPDGRSVEESLWIDVTR